MSYAVVASYTGAAKTTVNSGGVDYDLHTFASTSGGSIEFSEPGDVDYPCVAEGGSGGSHGTRGGGGGAVAREALRPVGVAPE